MNIEDLRQPSPQRDVPTFATDSPYKTSPYGNIEDWVLTIKLNEIERRVALTQIQSLIDKGWLPKDEIKKIIDDAHAQGYNDALKECSLITPALKQQEKKG